MTLYYVDSTVSDDTGDGSIGDPWRYVNTHVDELSAGDTMYLRGGGSRGAAYTYDENIDIRTVVGCADGTAANPITIRNYTGEYIEFTAADPDDRLFRIGCDYWRIIGEDPGAGSHFLYFNMQGAAANDYAIELDASTTNLTVSYCEFYNTSFPAFILIRGDYHTISYCLIHHNDNGAYADGHGIYIQGDASYNVIDNCEIYDCHGDCVQINDDVSTTKTANQISNCDLYATAAEAAGCENGVDDKQGSGTIVNGCTIHGFRKCDGSSGGSGADGSAMGFHTDATSPVIYDNVIYDCSGAAIGINMSSGTTVFRNNVIRDMVYEATIGERTFFKITNGNINFYNNTVVGKYSAPSGDDNLFRFWSTSDTSNIKNNIFSETGAIEQEGGTQNADYNCWYSCDQSLSGAHDVTDDPLFRDAANDDYSLVSTSPCIDAGTDVGFPYRGGAPDIGGIEYEPRIAGTPILRGFRRGVLRGFQ